MRAENHLSSTIFNRPNQQGWDGLARALFAVFLFFVASRSVTIAEQVDYEKQVKPIFAARCKACHGVLKQEGGLRLDTGALARKGSDSGTVIAPGKSAASELIARITSSDPSERMPQ